MSDKSVEQCRLELISRYTRDDELAVTSNIAVAVNALGRSIDAVDSLMDRTFCSETISELSHLRARLWTAGDILKSELNDIKAQSKR